MQFWYVLELVGCCALAQLHINAWMNEDINKLMDYSEESRICIETLRIKNNIKDFK